MKAIYNIDLNRYGLQLLPLSLRKNRMVALLKAAIRPLHAIHADFSKHRESARYALNHNGQVCYLCAVLNDRFDSMQRRISIEEVIKYTPVYFSLQSENKAVHFSKQEQGDVVVFAKEETIGVDSANFVVNIPLSLESLYSFSTQKEKERQIRLLVDQYKLVSKRYSVNFK